MVRCYQDNCRNTFEDLGSKIESQKIINKNRNIKYYAVASVLEKIKEEYIADDNKRYFDESLTELGNQK